MVIIKRAGAEDIRSRAHRGSKMVRITRADAEELRSRAHRGRKMATITKWPQEDIRSSAHRQERGDNKKIGCRVYTIKVGPTEGRKW